MAKLYKISDWRPGLADVYFYCPGCGCDHGVWTLPWEKYRDKDNNPVYGPLWGFNGDMEKPTFTPSIKVTYPEAGKEHICHSVITDGKISYCGDCTHELAGKVVEMENVTDK